MPSNSGAPLLEPAPHTAAGIDQAWQNLGQTGGWFSATERIAIVAETRAARDCSLCAERKQALSPFSSNDAAEHDRAPESQALSPATIDAIHRITTDPGRLSEHWYQGVLASGLAAEEVVELTSVVGATTIADTLARALSRPERDLPVKAASEEQPAAKPNRRPLAGTSLDRGWVPMVEPDSAEGMTKLMYEGVESSAGFIFNVARSLSAVPEAIRDFFIAFRPNYATHGPVQAGGLNRIQVELLASTTSAHNDCFY